jgi:hypothetical protein
VPLFGALTSTHLTATLQDPLPEIVNYTSLAKIRKEWIPPRHGPLAEVHQRLREVGSSYLAGR